MPEKVKKRDGRTVKFDKIKITEAIFKAAESVDGSDRALAEALSDKVTEVISTLFADKVPTIEDIQDTVEKVLIDSGHSRTAKAFILYRKKRDEIRAKTKVRRTVKKKSSITDKHLLVDSDSSMEYQEWDKSFIADSLVKEKGIAPDEAAKIASVVEKRVIQSGVPRISLALIRELVNNELFERGYTELLERQTLIGMTVAEIDDLIHSKSKENANITANNPEAINLAMSEFMHKQYALNKVFNQDVAEAHRDGTVHLHDLGMPTRAYCSGHSLEYIKKYGLNLWTMDTKSAPAQHANTLTGHLNTFLSNMQAYYAGALGLGAVNTFYSPYLEDSSDDEIRQVAQYMIFSGAQNCFSKGGQALFLDFNLDAGVPSYLKDVPAIGSGGKYTGRNYASYEKTAHRMAMAMLRVWKEGDSNGHLFQFPKPNFHINDETFSNPDHKKVFDYACEVAAHNGAPYFAFDRDSASQSACCRLRFTIEDDYLLKHPEHQRFCGFMNVTVNLPQCAYRAGKGKIRKLYAEIDKAMEICLKAHLQKKTYVAELMSAPNLPLWQLGKPACDGKPYVELDKCTYIIGMIGLNECVQFLLGKELHEDEDTLKAGLRIISHMFYTVKEFGERHGLKFTLEESPAESASRRFARIDLKKFPESADVIKGDIEKDECYYTNSIHLRADCGVDLVQRITKQAKFHNLIESGAIIHAFVGENRPSAKAIAKLVEMTYRKTNAAQITISPEFTVCQRCKKMIPGMSTRCQSCGSENVTEAKRNAISPNGTWTDDNINRFKGG
jgi:ribonucleoside-triphosphate reductase